MTSILARFRAFRDKNGHGNGDVRQYAYKIRKDVYVYDSGSDATLTSFNSNCSKQSYINKKKNQKKKLLTGLHRRGRSAKRLRPSLHNFFFDHGKENEVYELQTPVYGQWI